MLNKNYLQLTVFFCAYDFHPTLIHDGFSFSSTVPNSAKGLQLRSEVLHRLHHYQSALADADSALKCLPTSHKVRKLPPLP